MRNIVLRISLVFFVSVLAGCASGPKMQEIQSSFPEIGEGEGRIYFYRKPVFFGDGLQPDVYLNGEKIGKSVPKGFFFVDRPAGDYDVSTSTEVERNLSFQLNHGEEKYVRFNISMGVIVGRVLPVLMDRAEAVKELESMNYIGEPLSQ